MCAVDNFLVLFVFKLNQFFVVDEVKSQFREMDKSRDPAMQLKQIVKMTLHVVSSSVPVFFELFVLPLVLKRMGIGPASANV